jgi:hypothetical protein
MIRFYWARLKWLYQHRAERDCRQKWKRMERELARKEESGK